MKKIGDIAVKRCSISLLEILEIHGKRKTSRVISKHDLH
jgi:hypothetical protein